MNKTNKIKIYRYAKGEILEFREHHFKTKITLKESDFFNRESMDVFGIMTAKALNNYLKSIKYSWPN